MSQKIEIWIPIKGYENIYEISSEGNIKSLARDIHRNKMGTVKSKEKKLHPHVDKIGYPRVTLFINKTKYRESVHRLVAITFIPNPDNKPCVNHKNGIKTDNSISNLEWATNKENIIHSFKTGLNIASRGEDKGNAILKTEDVYKIRNLLKTGFYTQKQIGEMYGVSRGAIKGIKLNKNWKHI